jgi:hypothetical protein
MTQQTDLHDSLYSSLESYLVSAMETLSSWGEWLSEHERLVLDSDLVALESHAALAVPLQADLASLRARRSTVLDEAHAAGFTCSTLKLLAQALPQWRANVEFRQRVKNVERSMASLRRLNTAAWLLVNQCAHVIDETLLLMTSGSTMNGAYIDVPHADTTGGQILDTQV